MNSDSLNTNLKGELRDHGRTIVKNTLGSLRDFAVSVATESGINEEKVFDELCKQLFKGFRQELAKIIGPEKTLDFIDPFNARRDDEPMIQ